MNFNNLVAIFFLAQICSILIVYEHTLGSGKKMDVVDGLGYIQCNLPSKHSGDRWWRGPVGGRPVGEGTSGGGDQWGGPVGEGQG